jgi:hypothetical protein
MVRTANKILAALPKASREWLEMLEPVTLEAGTVLHEPDEAIEHVYFLIDALVSIMSVNSEGVSCRCSDGRKRVSHAERASLRRIPA